MENEQKKEKEEQQKQLNKSELIRLSIIGILLFGVIIGLLQLYNYNQKDKNKETKKELNALIEQRQKEKTKEQKQKEYEIINISKDSCKQFVKIKFEEMFTKENPGIDKYYNLNKIKRGEFKVYDIEVEYYGNAAKGTVYGEQFVEIEGETIKNKRNFDFVLSNNEGELQLMRWNISKKKL